MSTRTFYVLVFLVICSLLFSIAGFTFNWLQLTSLEAQVSSANMVQRKLDTPETSQYQDLVMGQARLSQQVSSLAAQLKNLPSLAASAKPVATTQTATKPREYIIYLGTGSTDQRDWVNISGAGVNFDPSKYQHIREVRFEAGLSIINGEVYARLYDAETGLTFYDSEVSHNTQTSTWKLSTPLTFPTGNHYYSVQLRSSSGEQANLTGSRLRVLAD